VSTCNPVRRSVATNDVHRRLFPWQPCCVTHNTITLPCHVSKHCNRCVRWHPFTLSIFLFFSLLLPRTDVCNYWAILAVYEPFQHINPLNAELNPICYLLALLGAHHILHVSRIRVNGHSYPQACAVSIYGFTYGHIPLPISVAARSKTWVCSRLPAGIAGSNPARVVDVCCDCCVLSGRGLCIGLITRPDEPYRMWCVACLSVIMKPR
jgi:hypothetical protein